jgi:hypothetical protein
LLSHLACTAATTHTHTHRFRDTTVIVVWYANKAQVEMPLRNHVAADLRLQWLYFPPSYVPREVWSVRHAVAEADN